MDSKQRMKNVSAGGSVSQSSDTRSTHQEMDDVTTLGQATQRIGTKVENNTLDLPGFGAAKGKWAVIVIGILFALFLLWRFLSGVR